MNDERRREERVERIMVSRVDSKCTEQRTTRREGWMGTTIAKKRVRKEVKE